MLIVSKSYPSGPTHRTPRVHYGGPEEYGMLRYGLKQMGKSKVESKYLFANIFYLQGGLGLHNLNK